MIKNQKGENKSRNTSIRAIFLSVILTGSLIAVGQTAQATPAMAAGFPHGDKKSATTDPNFDIKNFHREGNGKLVMEVFGQAGGTTPAKPATGELGQVFVYAFFADNGI